ncbi:type II toxin-antitoxin system HicA family toxin [Desulfotignum phosphitoxidans]
MDNNSYINPHDCVCQVQVDPGKVTVPHPKKDLPVGTLRSLYRQAGWQWR